MEFASEIDAQKVLDQESHFIMHKLISVQPTKNKILATENNAHDGRVALKQAPVDGCMLNGYGGSDLIENTTNFVEGMTSGISNTPDRVFDLSSVHVQGENPPKMGVRHERSASQVAFQAPITDLWLNNKTTLEVFVGPSEPQTLSRFDSTIPCTVPTNGQPGVFNNELAKSKRFFKLFYKQLKRPHIRARTTRKQENNYGFRVSKYAPSFFQTQVDTISVPVVRRVPPACMTK